MAGIDNPRQPEFWQREFAELAADMGASPKPVRDATRAKQCRFLAALADTGAPTVAAGVAGISMATTYKWASEDPVFHQCRELAKGAYSDLLVAELTRRGRDGIEITVYDKHGQVCGTERKYSDHLLAFGLKGMDKEVRWAQRVDAGTGRDGAWRADLARVLADPESRARLEALADLIAEKG